jgi:hypothetical protein
VSGLYDDTYLLTAERVLSQPLGEERVDDLPAVFATAFDETAACEARHRVLGCGLRAEAVAVGEPAAGQSLVGMVRE